jgi:hypothetical protein
MKAGRPPFQRAADSRRKAKDKTGYFAQHIFCHSAKKEGAWGRECPPKTNGFFLNWIFISQCVEKMSVSCGRYAEISKKI